MEIIHIKKAREAVRVLIRIVDGKKQDGNTDGDAKSCEQDIMIKRLQHNADAYHNQQLMNCPDLLPAQLFGF